MYTRSWTLPLGAVVAPGMNYSVGQQGGLVGMCGHCSFAVHSHLCSRHRAQQLSNPFHYQHVPRPCLIGLLLRACLAKRSTYLVCHMHHVARMSAPDIATAVGRHRSAIYRALATNGASIRQGRPLVLSEKQSDRLAKLIARMVVKADGLYEITNDMLRRAARIKACDKTNRKALR